MVAAFPDLGEERTVAGRMCQDRIESVILLVARAVRLVGKTVRQKIQWVVKIAVDDASDCDRGIRHRAIFSV